MRKYGASPKKVVHYPGVKEGIYLWELSARLRADSAEQRKKPRKVAYVRPEPWTAQYYKGARAFLDDLLLGMSDEMDVVLLPRGAAQAEHYQSERFARIRVAARALDIDDVLGLPRARAGRRLCRRHRRQPDEDLDAGRASRAGPGRRSLTDAYSMP